MKKIITLAFLLGMFMNLSFAQETTEQDIEVVKDGPIMTFETKEVDYGTIERGSDPLRVFNFTNTGNEPLVIKHAKGSCGCTVPTYPKEPINPGESAKIEVRYDTKRVGRFTKTVTLTTNTSVGKQVIKIKGLVNKPAAPKEAVPQKKDNMFNDK